MASWHQGGLFIEHAARISSDSLHMLVVLPIWLALALVLRRPVTSWMPWLWLLGFVLWNETVDLWVEGWPGAGKQFDQGARDLALMMFVPTLLMFAARWRPNLFRAAPGRRGRRR